jgi:phosphoglycolate phosphatase (TIGR01487 family)
MVPPLAADIDGTLTRPDGSLDPRVLDAIRAWDAPVVIATGKSFPYPVGLCDFIGIPTAVVAENGGVVFVETADEVVYNGDPEAAAAVAADYRAAGHDLGWGSFDAVNRWRETELAVAREQPLAPLEAIADAHGQVVVDTGYAYHVKSPDVDKATGLRAAARLLGVDIADFAAVGDSENDAELLGAVGRSFAVGNADRAAARAAGTVTDGRFADGFLEALERIERAEKR